MTFPLRDYKISSLFIWNVCSFSKSKQTKQFITPICSIFAVNDRFILLLINKSKHMYFSGEKFHINTFCTRFTWYFQGNLFWMHIKCNFEGKSGRERKHLLLTCSDSRTSYRNGRNTDPLLISTGFLKYPVSLDNFSISKFSVWEYENSISVLSWFL